MRTSLPAVLLAASAVAQPQVCATGIVEPVGGPTICMQGETHRLADTSLYLKSQMLDLNAFVGQLVRVVGADVGVTCRVLEVTQVTPPHAVLRWCGSPMPGCPIRLQVGPGALGYWWLFGAFGPGYLPVGCGGLEWIDGTAFLQLPPVAVAQGFFTGPWGEYVLQLPPNPSLVGAQVWFQGLRQDVGPVGPMQLTNVETFTITPFLPPCAGINC